MTKTQHLHFLTWDTKSTHCANSARIPYAGFCQIRSRNIIIIHFTFLYPCICRRLPRSAPKVGRVLPPQPAAREYFLAQALLNIGFICISRPSYDRECTISCNWHSVRDWRTGLLKIQKKYSEWGVTWYIKRCAQWFTEVCGHNNIQNTTRGLVFYRYIEQLVHPFLSWGTFCVNCKVVHH